MTTTTSTELAHRSSERQARLAAAVRGIRSRASITPDTWMLRVGGVLLPLGALVILLGWWGAAHTPRLFEQIPYLISGGLLGVAFVVAGGFLFFAYWLTLMVRENRSQAERAVEALGRIEALIAALPPAPAEPAGDAPARATAPFQPAAAVGGPVSPNGTRLVATANGSMYHRPDCPVVANREGLRSVTADTPGFSPCRICEPLTAAH